MGADKVVNRRDPEALTTFAGQFDLIINTVNVDLDWLPYFKALAYGGKFHTVGAVMKLASHAKVAPQTELFPMSKINEAIQHVRDGKARYRVVLKADF